MTRRARVCGLRLAMRQVASERSDGARRTTAGDGRMAVEPAWFEYLAAAIGHPWLTGFEDSMNKTAAPIDRRRAGRAPA